MSNSKKNQGTHKDFLDYLETLQAEEDVHSPNFYQFSQLDEVNFEDLFLDQKQLYLSDFWLGLINKF